METGKENPPMTEDTRMPDIDGRHVVELIRERDSLRARVAELEGEGERLRSVYQGYRERIDRVVWDSVRYGGKTADETIAELERVVTKARRGGGS